MICHGLRIWGNFDMKSIAQVSNQVVNQQRSGAVTEQPDTQSINVEAAKVVNDIFRALQASFPAWRQAFPDDAALKAAKASWVKGLIAAGVTDRAQIAAGINRARLTDTDFFPSVGRFIGWCTPQATDLGMPSESDAWREANQHSHEVITHKWVHAGVYEAGRRLGWFDIREGRATEKGFAQVYRQVVEEVANGSVFEIPAQDATRLEHQSGPKTLTEESKELGRAALSTIKEMVQ